MCEDVLICTDSSSFPKFVRLLSIFVFACVSMRNYAQKNGNVVQYYNQAMTTFECTFLSAFAVFLQDNSMCSYARTAHCNRLWLRTLVGSALHWLLSKVQWWISSLIFVRRSRRQTWAVFSCFAMVRCSQFHICTCAACSVETYDPIFVENTAERCQVCLTVWTHTYFNLEACYW